MQSNFDNQNSLKQRYTKSCGVKINGTGVDVCIFAPDATRVEFCLLDKAGDAWYQRSFDLQGPYYGFFEGFIDNVNAGHHYGFRVHGPWDPQNGQFFNPAKLLVDPYARGIENNFIHREEVFSYKMAQNSTGTIAPLYEDGKLIISEEDSCPFVPHSVVMENDTTEEINHPYIPWSKTIIYELHVKGFTKTAPWLPEELRGTYAGLGHEGTIKYLKELGVTTIELLPIHSMLSESHLLGRELTNYWGYSTLSFFAPNPSYATIESQNKGANAVVQEVKQMVKSLHDAGIEVLMDVVYNHSCEEGNEGPTVCYRGIANQNYYVHPVGMPGSLYDTTGCGNTFNFREPHVVRMALDSLKYWANNIGVDGFRFDLMVSTARGEHGFSKEHPFLVGIKNDLVLGNLKMIAEPWDLGDFGWQTGAFGFPFSEWNDSFRNDMRSFWAADLGRIKAGWTSSSIREIATRISGSHDIFGSDPLEKFRGPISSVNYITAHDGFTMRDIATYDQKHNEANKEDNRDGTDNNNSYNHGYEGFTTNRKIKGERRKTIRNLLAMLLLSSGTPMLLAGDELGRTQGGNNNAYCQDNQISWLNWNLQKWQTDLIATTKHLIWIRNNYSALRPTSYFSGQKREDQDDIKDLTWFDFAGNELNDETWQNAHLRNCQCLFKANSCDDGDILLVINGLNKNNQATLPTVRKFKKLWDSRYEVPKEFIEMKTTKTAPFSVQVFASFK